MGGIVGEDSEVRGTARYRAFVSYSHADARFAGWLHRKLEAWSRPGQARLTPIFIDHAELAAGPDLSAQVRDALAESAALIVVASPAARASRWVAQEISLFRELHPDRPVLAALLQGEPIEAFPESLLIHQNQALEPLAADFREGHDGKRLGLLKILAGLTAQPLDRLVQRDTQSRQRRVMAVTAGALLLSLVLAALLVVALRARTEAEHQRVEAEGMVEFMLTDLRDKLKGVGRLDIMDAVNARAMAHYAKKDLSSLPDDVLERRARLLLAMAEDDLNSEKSTSSADAEITEAWRTTGLLLQRRPAEPERIFEHAQSEYWMGYLNYRRKISGKDGHVAAAERHWQSYRTLAGQLIEIDPVLPRWRRELAFAEGNLCTLLIALPQRARTALPHCVVAREAMEGVAANTPYELAVQLDVANRLAWEADALAAQQRFMAAAAIRRRQLALVAGLPKQFGSDARTREAVLAAQLGLARALRSSDEPAEAAMVAGQARISANSLRKLDPENRNWRDWQAKIDHEFPDH